MFNYNIIYLVFIVFQMGFSQTHEYYFRHYKVENGLSHSSVLCSLQDQKGFLWFGTKDGLNRFDGYSFKHFRNDFSSPNSLGSNFIESIHEFDNALWVGTDSGLYKYDETQNNFNIIDQSLNSPILDIENDNDGNLWFIANSALYKYNVRTLKSENYINDVLRVEEITKTADGKIWVAFQNVIYEYIKETNSFKKHEILLKTNNNLPIVISKIYGINDNQIVIGTQNNGAIIYNTENSRLDKIYLESKNPIYIRDLIKTKNNDLWIATESGLYIYNLNKNTSINLTKSYNNPYSLSDNALYSLTIDKEDGVWIGSYFGGINYYPKSYSFFKKYYPKLGENSISGNAVREIYPDLLGNLWIGTEDAGVNRLNTKTGVFTNYLPSAISKSISYHNIHGLLIHDSKLWIGTFEHGIDIMDINTGLVTKHYSTSNSNLLSDFAFAFYKNKKEDIFAITTDGIQVYDQKNDDFKTVTGFPEGYFFTSFLEDNSGALWAGTYWEGLFYFNPKTNKKFVFRHDNKLPGSISSNAINGIFQDSENNLWITTENGLNLYDFDTKKFKNYTVKDGLPSNVTYSILEDEEKRLWVSTSKGLVQYNIETEEIKIYSTANGLLSDQFNYHSAYKDENGTMYFGCVDGMISFNPENFLKNEFKAPIYITNIQIDDKDVKPDILDDLKSKSPLYQISLQPNEFSINIEFSALSFNASEMTDYWYSLDGFNNDWVYLGKNHNVSFTGLPPNVYTFKIKSRNSNGIWSEEGSRLEINVLPPFWKSKFAYTFYTFILALVVFLLLKGYKSRLKNKNIKIIEELNRQKEKELYKAKIEFFTNISHEIRTPLTLIKSPLEKILEKTDYDKDLTHNLSIMDKNTTRLLNLVNQLLDFRKTEQEETALTFVKVNVSELIRNMYVRFSPTITNKKIEFSYDLGDEDVFVLVDIEALKKILSNLFSNAIKYANQIIKLSLVSTEDFFEIIIKNDGKLIPSYLKDKIFEPFYMISEQNNTANSSTGIGLSLAHSLVELHKGSLKLDTSVLDMNVFVLNLPIHQVNEFKLFDSVPPVIEENIEEYLKTQNTRDKSKILLVEDNDDLLDFVSRELSEDYQVIKTTNAKRALEVLNTENVHLVISDVMMPGMDGYEFCEEIKTNVETSHIPIILLTAKSTLNSRIEGLELGADAYIEKPFSMIHLKAQISNLILNRAYIIDHYSSSPLAHVKSIAHSTTDQIFIKKLDEAIYLNISDNNLNVEVLAEIMSMSKSTLYRKIKNISNLSPNELINITRLKKAAEYLITGDYKIYEIAEMVGYSSQASLLRNFQKQFKETPSEYMKSKK